MTLSDLDDGTVRVYHDGSEHNSRMHTIIIKLVEVINY